MEKIENPQAFPSEGPITEEGRYCYDYVGMTLRDYFAAQVLPSLISKWGIIGGHDTYVKSAKEAYSIADEMLKERTK